MEAESSENSEDKGAEVANSSVEHDAVGSTAGSHSDGIPPAQDAESIRE